MRAAWYEKKGPASAVLKFGEIDAPEPGPGEVRVKVMVSGVNPSDVKRMGGRSGGPGMDFPRVVPHMDGAGVVDSVGPGVDPGRVGRRVWIYEAELGRPYGTAAEYTVVPSERAVDLPDRTSFHEGACLGVPAMTAHHVVFMDGPVKDQYILVSGGAGSVGHYAVQFAKWGGAGVIATVGSPEKAELALAAGADQVVDYKREDVAERVMCLTAGRGVDRIVEVAFGTNIDTDAKILRTGGTIATYASDARLEPAVPFYPLILKHATIRFAYVYAATAQAHQAAVAGITACLREGRLSHLVGPRFPLRETDLAYEALRDPGRIGHVVVDIGE
jgi:NADPH2:quinone reductase